jgi:hypothetical protein
MILRPASFRLEQGDCLRLALADRDRLADQYWVGGGVACSQAQFKRCIFCGIEERGQVDQVKSDIR